MERELIREAFPYTYKVYENGNLVKKYSNIVASDFENLVNNRNLVEKLPKVAVDNMKR